MDSSPGQPSSKPKDNNLAKRFQLGPMGIAIPICQYPLPRLSLQAFSAEGLEEVLKTLPPMLLEKLRIQVENVLDLLIEFLIVGFDGAVFKVADPIVNAVIWVCGIELNVLVALSCVTVLQLWRTTLVPHASSQEVHVVELLSGVQVLAVPVGDLHGRDVPYLT
jgi:hypothetical protein